MALETLSSNVYEVQIGGYSLKLKADQSAAQVAELVQTVESQVQESLKKSRGISVQKALILSCLNIAEDHLKMKKKALEEIQQMESKLRSIIHHLKSKQKI